MARAKQTTTKRVVRNHWCRIYNINYQTAWKKYKNGYNIERILKLDKC